MTLFQNLLFPFFDNYITFYETHWKWNWSISVKLMWAHFERDWWCCHCELLEHESDGWWWGEGRSRAVTLTRSQGRVVTLTDRHQLEVMRAAWNSWVTMNSISCSLNIRRISCYFNTVYKNQVLSYFRIISCSLVV